MSAITETTVTNNATVAVAHVASNAVATTALKKSFPAKYLKVLSVSLYLLKKMHPDVYVDKFVEHMKLNDSIESVISEIDEHVFAAATDLENEVKQIKRDLGKKPKKSRVAKSKKVATDSAKGTKVETDCAKGTTEQLVELANEPTIVRGGDEPVVPKKTKKSKKTPAPVTETASPVVVEDTVQAPETPAPVTETPAPKAKVTKPKAPKVVEVPKVTKEELDVGEPKVAEVAEQPAPSKEKKAPKKAASKKAAPVQQSSSEIAPSEELVEEEEQ